MRPAPVETFSREGYDIGCASLRLCARMPNGVCELNSPGVRITAEAETAKQISSRLPRPCARIVVIKGLYITSAPTHKFQHILMYTEGISSRVYLCVSAWIIVHVKERNRPASRSSEKPSSSK